MNTINGLCVVLLLTTGEPPQYDPPLRDADRLPCLWVCRANYEFTIAHHVWLYTQREDGLQIATDWSAQQWEAEQCMHVWGWIVDARDPQYPAAYRSLMLSNLRKRIGKYNYDNVILPAPAPYWRFTQRDKK